MLELLKMNKKETRAEKEDPVEKIKLAKDEEIRQLRQLHFKAEQLFNTDIARLHQKLAEKEQQFFNSLSLQTAEFDLKKAELEKTIQSLTDHLADQEKKVASLRKDLREETAGALKMGGVVFELRQTVKDLRSELVEKTSMVKDLKAALRVMRVMEESRKRGREDSVNADEEL